MSKEKGGMRVEVKPELLRWARERADLDLDALVPRFPKLPAWESGEGSPPFKQPGAFAKATRVPFGYLFLPEPLEEPVPIPDFRTVRHAGLRRPRPALLHTVYAMPPTP